MPATKSKPKSRARVKTSSKTGMPMLKVKEKARELGLTPGKMSKFDLIHAIQEAEYCTPCYGTSNGECGNIGCCFMTDCIKVK